MIPNQQPGLAAIQNKEQADIKAKAQAFLMSGDQIGFIGKLASEAPTEIAPVVNAARRMAKEAQAAQQPQTESITTAGMREVEQAKRGLAAAYELSQSQQQRDPRQTAIAGLPMQKQMFAGKRAGGIVAFAGPEGSFVDALRKREEDKRISGFERLLRGPEGAKERYEQNQALIRERQKLTNEGFGQGFLAGLFKNETEAEYQARIAKNKERDKALADTYLRGDKASELRKTDQSEEITKEELNKRIAEQDSRDLFRDQPALDALKKIRPKKVVDAEAEAEAKQTIVPETATDAAIGEAGVDTKPISVEDAFAQAKSIFSLKNVAKDGAISTEIEAPEDYNTRVINIMKKAGVDFDNSAQQAALEAEKAALAGDKKEAVYMSLLELGFAIMGGKDPNAIANIGKAGMQVAPALAKRIQATKDARRKVLDSEIRLAELKNKRAEGVARITADMIVNAENQAQQNKRTEMQVTGNLTRQIMGDKNAMDVAKVKAKSTIEAQKIAARVKSLSRADLALQYANASDEKKKELEAGIKLAYPQTGAQMIQQLASTMANTKGSTISKEKIRKDIESYGVTLDNTDG